MSTIKIEHVNPVSGKPVAFDLERGGNRVETFVLTHGQMKIIDLAGDLVLRETSVEAIAARGAVAELLPVLSRSPLPFGPETENGLLAAVDGHDMAAHEVIPAAETDA
jgi:hypothetical protein